MQETIYFLSYPFHIIRKQQRRSLIIKLHPNKPNQVLANKSISLKVINEFLTSKKDWLEKNLVKIENYKSSIPIPEFKEGQLFPLFGEMKYFKFALTKLKKIQFSCEDGFLVCYVPSSNIEWQYDIKKLQVGLIKYYKNEAKKFLIQRCQFLSDMTALHPSCIKLQTARSRWGSCNSKKAVHLNWKLVVFPLALIDYVIIHELCHLKHLNHSEQFWNLVSDQCPNYREIQKNLKDQTRSASFLDLIA
ncbi:MAG: SprT family zinc-dependent metalloprotease [Pseudobdellovibrio sp.]